MSFAARVLGGGTTGGGFVPVTRTYTSGSGNETPPVGATACLVTDQAGGAGAWNTGGEEPEFLGGGAGGEAVISTASLTGPFAWAVGAGSGGNSNLPGGNSSVTGNGVNLNARGGGVALVGGAGGIATGGSTNTTGGSASGGLGGTSPNTPNGDGGSFTGPGKSGLVSFAYT